MFGINRLKEIKEEQLELEQERTTLLRMIEYHQRRNNFELKEIKSILDLTFNSSKTSKKKQSKKK